MVWFIHWPAGIPFGLRLELLFAPNIWVKQAVHCLICGAMHICKISHMEGNEVMMCTATSFTLECKISYPHWFRVRKCAINTRYCFVFYYFESFLSFPYHNWSGSSFTCSLLLLQCFHSSLYLTFHPQSSHWLRIGHDHHFIKILS